MLTVEEIKKIFDNFEVEGFSRHERSCSSFTIEHGHSSFEIEYDTGKGSSNTEVYELFLQRVIEGINRKSVYESSIAYTISIDQEMIRIEKWFMPVMIIEFVGDNIPIDQAKEQAIIYILDQME